MEMERCTVFNVDQDGICSRIGEISHISVGFDDHQVDINRLARIGTNGLHKLGADSSIWNKPTIQHIHMYPICPDVIDGLHFFP